MAISERVENGIAEVVIHSPPVNAATIGDLAELARCFGAYASRPEVRVAILSGDGRGFVGGGDVKEVAALPGNEGILGQARGSLAATSAIYHCAVPVIAAVHGYCIGVGVLLAGSADLIVAAEGTRFILAEVDNGAAACGATHASTLLPEKRLRQAIYTGEPVDVAELARYGSIASVVPDADLLPTARALAAGIAGKHPRVIRQAKASLNAVHRLDLDASYRTELSYLYELNLAGEGQEARETFLDGLGRRS